MIIKYHNHKSFWNNRLNVVFERKIKVNNSYGLGFQYDFKIQTDLKSIVIKLGKDFTIESIEYGWTDSDKDIPVLNTSKDWKYVVHGHIYSHVLMTWDQLWSYFLEYARENLQKRKRN